MQPLISVYKLRRVVKTNCFRSRISETTHIQGVSNPSWQVLSAVNVHNACQGHVAVCHLGWSWYPSPILDLDLLFPSFLNGSGNHSVRCAQCSFGAFCRDSGCQAFGKRYCNVADRLNSPKKLHDYKLFCSPTPVIRYGFGQWASWETTAAASQA